MTDQNHDPAAEAIDQIRTAGVLDDIRKDAETRSMDDLRRHAIDTLDGAGIVLDDATLDAVLQRISQH